MKTKGEGENVREKEREREERRIGSMDTCVWKRERERERDVDRMEPIEWASTYIYTREEERERETVRRTSIERYLWHHRVCVCVYVCVHSIPFTRSVCHKYVGRHIQVRDGDTPG